MTPSLEIREEAARLFDEAWAQSDAINTAEDAGAKDDDLEALEDACAEAWQAYSEFCDRHDFELLTEASGYIIRCARTKITLCDLDEVEELESGELVLKAAEHAAA